jgi:hypothetical protein
MNLGKLNETVKTYEEFLTEKSLHIDEGLKDTVNAALKRGAEFAKDVWDGVKRESRETKEVVRLLGELMKGRTITDTQKKFIKAQSIDLAKSLPLIAIQGIPLPIPITPFLILLGKKVGFDILPNSHTKVNYEI